MVRVPIHLYQTGGYPKGSRARPSRLTRHRLVAWRSPDAEIHRILTLRGAMSGAALADTMRINRKCVENALNRMAKHRVVVVARVTDGARGPKRLWSAAA